MSYRSVLVHVDDAAASQTRLDYAVRLARGFDAELVGIYLVPGTDLAPSTAAILPPEVVERKLGEFNDAQHAAEKAFRSATAGLAVDWRAPAGTPIDAAVAHGRCAVLFIVGQRDAADSGFADSLVTNVLLSSGRPTMVVPYTGVPAGIGENVLVAWNGGREAARAIGDALPLLERAKRIDVLAVDDDAQPGVAERLAGARLGGWLRAHGITATVARHEVRDIGVGEWLLDRAADLGSDLIVMGGYGHARMRELVLGGVTRTVVRAMTVPVFMAH
jgi:nucleotide-binding universal stress UspA family protein